MFASEQKRAAFVCTSSVVKEVLGMFCLEQELVVAVMVPLVIYDTKRIKGRGK